MCTPGLLNRERVFFWLKNSCDEILKRRGLSLQHFCPPFSEYSVGERSAEGGEREDAEVPAHRRRLYQNRWAETYTASAVKYILNIAAWFSPLTALMLVWSTLWPDNIKLLFFSHKETMLLSFWCTDSLLMNDRCLHVVLNFFTDAIVLFPSLTWINYI